MALIALAALVGVAPALTAGSPIQLSAKETYPFSGASLVVRDLDGTSGPDLLGVSGPNVVVAPNNGFGRFGVQQLVSMGTFDLVSLQAADVNGDGRVDLVATSTAPELLVRLNLGGMSFGPAQATPLAFGGRALALGDLNGDGRADAVAGGWGSNAFAVLLNDGLGHMGAPAVFTAGNWFLDPLIADFTGDGHADVLAAVHVPDGEWGHGELVLFAGRGDGTLDPPVTAGTGELHRYSVTAADFDGDGDLDVGAAGDTDAVIYENLGAGMFAAPAVLNPGRLRWYGGSLGRIASGDMTGDGRTDLVVGVRWPTGFLFNEYYLVVFPNRGGLSFDIARSYRSGGTLSDVAVADLDRDGRLDGIATCADANELVAGELLNGPSLAIVHRGMGPHGLTGLMQVHDPVWLPVRPGALAPPDLFGTESGLMYRARNLGTGLFAASEVVGRGEPIAAVDLDGAGGDDLLVASQDSLWVLLHPGDGDLGPPTFLTTGAAFFDFADADVDGRLDLFLRDPSGEIRLLPGDGAGGFGPAVSTGVLAPVRADSSWPGAAHDVNGDGRADLLFAEYNRPEPDYGGGAPRYEHVCRLIARLGTGFGGFAEPETSLATLEADYYRSGGGGPLRFGDWNGDGHVDVACGTNICTSGGTGWFAAFHGDGAGNFTALAALESGSTCDLAVADLNRDGLDDLVYTISTAGPTHSANILGSTGLGGFVRQSYQMGDEPVRLHLADFDGDGWVDVLTENRRPPYYLDRYYTIRRNLTPPGLPTPALASLVSARVEDGVVHLEWFAAGAAFAGTVERRTATTGWVARAVRSSDGAGHVRYADREVEAGETYAYRLRGAGMDGEWAGEAWVHVPAVAFALRGASPNPSAAQPTIAFTLPAAGDAELHVLDVSGRMVRRERLAGLGAGAQRVTLQGQALAPGFYFVRLVFGERKLLASMVVLN